MLEAAIATPTERPVSDSPPPPPPAQELQVLLEALLFVADGPVEESALARVLGVTRRQLEAPLTALADAMRERGLRVQRGPDGVQLVTAPAAAAYIEQFLGLESGRRLSNAALETLAIIAYRQPVTRATLEAIRGVNSDGAVDTLRARGLVDMTGRADGPGRPALFSTTQKFLEYFGLERSEELPELPPEVAEAAANLPDSVAQQLPLASTDRPADRDEATDGDEGRRRFEPIETPEGRVWPARGGLPVQRSTWLPSPPSLPPVGSPALPSVGGPPSFTR
jgi:segregation and condensation protein B